MIINDRALKFYRNNEIAIFEALFAEVKVVLLHPYLINSITFLK